MTARTPEQIEADEALTIAIEMALRAYLVLEDDERVVTYAVVGVSTTFEMIEQDRRALFSVFKDNAVSDPEALGLFMLGAERIRKLGWNDA